jgi:hypothetical protein
MADCKIGLPYRVNTKLGRVSTLPFLETEATFIAYFSEHIQGTWVVTSKPHSEVEDEIGATETESDVQ